ncbi:MAG: alpha-L-fucosidase [Candidatus Omnitrophica bacterium]|nr:alpha-L-fucosidase [Candidatus Omnitrophota bacterium]
MSNPFTHSLYLIVILTAFSLPHADLAEAEDYLHAPPEAVKEWRELKFGMFIHWGPVSLMGTEIGWSRGGERRGQRGTGDIPVEIYDNLYKKFNPTEFDADEWVRIAQEAGMKYLVFTTKHHDGFVNFDSKLTDYKITSPESPYGKDIVKQLADACHKAGLDFGIYYSPPDWHHPDYRTENHERYIEYLHGQLKELCSNYGDIDMIFFDGLGGTAEDWNAKPLFKMIRDLQPDVIINNRCGLPGDNQTPEQKIGAFQTDPPWETCMTIGTQWAWKPDDKIKSVKECVQTLVRVAGNDGNLLFNVGPMPDGRIEPCQVGRLEEIGDWLDQYGESIYATRGGPIVSGPWGVTTYKDNKVYVHVLEWEGDSLELPPLEGKILDSELMTGGKVEVVQSEDGVSIKVPREDRDPVDTIVVMRVDDLP